MTMSVHIHTFSCFVDATSSVLNNAVQLLKLTASPDNSSIQNRCYSHVVISSVFPDKELAGDISAYHHVGAEVTGIYVIPSQLATELKIGDCMWPPRGHLHDVPWSLENSQH